MGLMRYLVVALVVLVGCGDSFASSADSGVDTGAGDGTARPDIVGELDTGDIDGHGGGAAPSPASRLDDGA
jgi:hypothetical protein